ncbi:PPE family protein [Mycobacterium lacus]|uniref:PPE family protein n=1 Tax=Mycobacterium lacus TaxID=169765 RepID=A0A1X1XMZ1_9MYCO|nr:PPE family protein [Mycobacterium lacus]MCV7125861.1 PPE family protein [Mycobacterium lacus]ORW00099.1 hypothetical protein AWC15_09450 [Mycobacterium lacus]BBX97497.1 PPE family protein [Mycobacterium lacus]
MDFATLPPEINSGRMYSGPGAGSMLAAASAWEELAVGLYAAASGYGSATAGLAGKWDGPAAAAMARAAAPYTAWLSATAAQAEQAAARARAAVRAYEAAFAATVPPPMIVANRTLLMSLMATNILGQNAPAIAATEADYDEMWAQDAAAMYGYAAASATASKVTPFTPPPTTTDPAGVAMQGAAVAHAIGTSAGTAAQEAILAGSRLVSTVPQVLEGLAASSTVTQLNAAWASLSSSVSKLSSLTVPLNFAMYPLNFLDKGLGFAKAATGPVTAAAAGAMKAVESGAHSLGSVVLGVGGAGSDAAMSAAVGRGMSIGALSVPQAWITTPASPIAAALPSAGLNAAPLGSADLGSAGMPLMPFASMGGRGTGGPPASRFELRPSVVPRSPAGG